MYKIWESFSSTADRNDKREKWPSAAALAFNPITKETEASGSP